MRKRGFWLILTAKWTCPGFEGRSEKRESTRDQECFVENDGKRKRRTFSAESKAKTIRLTQRSGGRAGGGRSCRPPFAQLGPRAFQSGFRRVFGVSIFGTVQGSQAGPDCPPSAAASSICLRKSGRGVSRPRSRTSDISNPPTASFRRGYYPPRRRFRPRPCATCSPRALERKRDPPSSAGPSCSFSPGKSR